MDQLFADGRIVDIVIGFVLLEVAALIVFRKATARRFSFLDIVTLMAPGVALLLALRAALTGAFWGQIALWLLVSLVAHLVDLGRRLAHS